MQDAEFEKERLKNKNKRLEAEVYMIKKARWKRLTSISLMLIFVPIFIPIHILLIIIAAISKHHKSTLIYYYLKIYFNIYFYFSGIEIFNVYPIPKPLPKPSIFFAIRSINLTTPFLQTQFPNKVELPYQRQLAHIPIHPLFPILRMGAFAKSFGYPDNPLSSSIDQIEHLLHQNKPIVIYIHPHYIDPQFSETLLLYDMVLDLLETNIDCHFIKANLIESYKIGTLLHKTPVSIYCKKSKDVIGEIKNKENAKIETSLKIMEFFEFKNVRII
jgi:hypothetical protein